MLSGRVALVTGASRGIGAVIAERFAAEGAAVAVTGRTVDPEGSRFPGTIHETVARIREAGGTAAAVAADLSGPDERERVVAETVAALGPVDVLVNNAAVTFFSPVAQFTAKRRQLMFDVQVEAPFHLAQLVLPGMIGRGAGWILNISSGASRQATVPPDPARPPGGTVYGMCKAALERFSTGLAAETYTDNVAVNSLSPNRVVPTPGTVFHHLVRPEDPDQVVEPPAVMAEAALALCSAPPQSRTGRIAYSQDLLNELGITPPGAAMSAVPEQHPPKPVPRPTPETEPYWEGTAHGELRLQRCNRCGRAYFYPRPSCPSCASTDVSWFRATGRGRLHTYLITHRAGPGFAGQVPYAIAVVELEEGPRMMTNIVGVANTPEALELDMALEVGFEARGDHQVPVFRPAGSTP